MTTKLKFLVFTFFVIVFSSFTPNSYALTCAVTTLGYEYERSEYVFHGKYINKNYPIFDDTSIITFEVLELFKGKNTDRLSIRVDNFYTNFIPGLEYIVFAQRDNSALVHSDCMPVFAAFPTSIELVKKLTIPNSFIHDKYTSYITDSVTQTELDNVDKLVAIGISNYYTSDFYERHFHTIRDIIVILSFVISGTVIFIYFIRKKKNDV